MSVTHSNHDYEYPTQPVYIDQLKVFPLEQLNAPTIEAMIENVKDRQRQATQARKDLGHLLRAWGEATQTPFFTNDDETIYAGPPAEGNRPDKLIAGTGWIILFISRSVGKKQIEAAIDEMRTYGRRKRSTAAERQRYRNKPSPEVKQHTNLKNQFGI